MITWLPWPCESDIGEKVSTDEHILEYCKKEMNESHIRKLLARKKEKYNPDFNDDKYVVSSREGSTPQWVSGRKGTSQLAVYIQRVTIPLSQMQQRCLETAI
ncbi:hypothetical protein TNCV_1168181 [Trichonephila clavipes]|uniref:Uncharacterized protein n=1 Tax=Trichonephila clavipes TaxID=2585209 RepID=A0A8X6T1Q4_TRICX|nr:hypothetical protein TNCV_1168181 [Trichonephila clavipes]